MRQNPRKSILAILFLFVYSLGFGHCNSPLCQNEEMKCGANDEVHSHPHHIHGAEDSSSDHKDIEHNGHLDEGFLDLIECVLSDVNLVDANCELYTGAPLKGNLKGISKIKLTAVLIAIFREGILQKESSSPFADEQTLYFDIVLIRSNPHRGPPVISC